MRHGLAGKRVLVVEDEYFLADDLTWALRDAGAEVVGPCPKQDQALRLVAEEAIDLAVVDINLKGVTGFVVADALAAKTIPFVFATGYDSGMIPARYSHIARWEKPFRASDLAARLAREGRPPN